MGCALVALMLWGCGSAYDYYDTTESLNRVTVTAAYWPTADSAIIAFAEAESLSCSFSFREYQPEAKGIKKQAAFDSLENIISVSTGFENSREPISIKLGVQYTDSLGHRASAVGGYVYMDIYGCSDYGCKHATKIILRDEDYSYYKLLSKEDFKISVPAGKFYAREHGYDCDVTKEYFFHVEVDTDFFRIDMDVQKGKETCLERDAICYGFC